MNHARVKVMGGKFPEENKPELSQGSFITETLLWIFTSELPPLWQFILPSGFHTDLMSNVKILSKEVAYKEQLSATTE